MDGGTFIEKSKRHRALPGTGAVADLAELLNFRAMRLTRKVPNSLQRRLTCNGWNLEVCSAGSSRCSFSLED